jgi:hypothetical protein
MVIHRESDTSRRDREQEGADLLIEQLLRPVGGAVPGVLPGALPPALEDPVVGWPHDLDERLHFERPAASPARASSEVPQAVLEGAVGVAAVAFGGEVHTRERRDDQTTARQRWHVLVIGPASCCLKNEDSEADGLGQGCDPRSARELQIHSQL